MGLFGRIANLGRGLLRSGTRSSDERRRDAALQAELEREYTRRPAASPSGGPREPAESEALAALRERYNAGELTEREFLLKRAAVLEGRDPDDAGAPGDIERTL